RKRQTQVAGIADRERRQVSADRELHDLEQHESRNRDRREHHHGRPDHREELAERQRELRQAAEHEAGPGHVHDQARDEVEIETRTDETPDITYAREAEHGREHPGDLRNHRLRLRAAAESARMAAEISRTRTAMLGQFFEISLAAQSPAE